MDGKYDKHPEELGILNKNQKEKDKKDRIPSPTGVNQVPSTKGGKRRKKRGGHHLFKRLGVSRRATKRQIKKAYEKRKRRVSFQKSKICL